MAKKKKKPRDLWIFHSWTYNGSGFEKNKKKTIDRKKKYKNKEED